MKISAVIPTYNRRDHIGATIEAMLAQTSPPDEIVVVDDGSTDGTFEHLRQCFPQVRSLRISNGGPVVARLHGIAHARGDWIALCDSDDAWHPEHLARRRRMHERHPAAQVSFGNCLVRFEDTGRTAVNFDCAPAGYWEAFGGATDLPDVRLATQAPYGQMVRYLPVYPSTHLFSRALYERVGGFDAAFSRIVSEDLEFTLRCAQEAPWLADLRPTVTISRHGANLSGDRIKVVLGDLRILAHAARMHPAGQRHAGIIADESARRAREAIDHAFASGDMGAVGELLRYIPAGRRDLKLRAKMLVSRLPAPLAGAVAMRLAA